MIVWEVARKYAQALFLSTEERNLSDAAYEQLGDLKELIRRDSSMLTFLTAPQVLDENKKALVRKVFEGRIEQLLVEFLVVLVDKNRIVYLREIIDEYRRLVEARQGLGRVTVISAVPLTDAERDELTRRMAAKTGLKIILEEKIDPTVIAGLVVLLHDEIIDGSVSHGLQLLREQLEEVRVH
ncbi:MAG: ATP synthase F1 subunit delta [Candidatus Zixiibacteriota bacterium]|nr:MAG: ATP synthase F1 subunit delta [candidate division Zixibacteria bacterium]